MRANLKSFVFLPVIVAIVLLPGGQVLAIDRYVDNTPGCGGNSPCYSTIQAAIDDAGTGDTVRVANGTYTGSGNRNIDFKGKAVTVQSDGGPTACTIDVEGTFNRGFIFQTGEGAGSVLTGFTITDANAFNGAAIYCDAASPTITDCHFIGNAANNDGGGMYLGAGSSPEITDCLFSSNTASRWGGGIYINNSSPTISNCQFNNNSANTVGGGIYCDNSSSANITDCSFSNNTANLGGGIACRSSSPSITNSTFSTNTAEANGGGIYCNSSSPDITGGTITGNTADSYGGGIYCESGSAPNITSCTISNNTATDRNGGGIFSDSSSPVISDSNISGNNANSGGGVGTNDSNLSLTNCTISTNIASNRGGGIYFFFNTPSILDSTISDNTADEGGGIYLDSSSPNVNQTTISGNIGNTRAGGILCNLTAAFFADCIIDDNSAETEGGIRFSGGDDARFVNCVISNNTADYGAGIGIYSSAPVFVNCTVTKNAATNQGGGLRVITTSFQRPEIYNTIFWDDTPDEIALISGPILIEYSDIEGGYSGTGNINSNPSFVDPVNNDFHLNSGSSCIDAATSDNAPNVDLEWTPRWDDPATPNTGGGDEPYYDIGAYEYFPWCECDFEPAEGDGDVDGADLAAYMADDGGIGLADFAEEFGRDDCP